MDRWFKSWCVGCGKVQTVNSDRQQKASKAVSGTRRLLPGMKVGEGFTPHPFDLEFGVRTSGLIAGRHLKSGHRHDRQSTAYYGVAPSVFQSMVVRWRRTKPVGPIDVFTFVDLGAGMGRAVLLASEFPFREAVGVELHQTLAGIARKNAARWRKLIRTGTGTSESADARALQGCGGVWVPSWTLCVVPVQPVWRAGSAVVVEEAREWAYEARG